VGDRGDRCERREVEIDDAAGPEGQALGRLTARVKGRRTTSSRAARIVKVTSHPRRGPVTFMASGAWPNPPPQPSPTVVTWANVLGERIQISTCRPGNRIDRPGPAGRGETRDREIRSSVAIHIANRRKRVSQAAAGGRSFRGARRIPRNRSARRV
jgi:hypothetical protein